MPLLPMSDMPGITPFIASSHAQTPGLLATSAHAAVHGVDGLDQADAGRGFREMLVASAAATPVAPGVLPPTQVALDGRATKQPSSIGSSHGEDSLGIGSGHASLEALTDRGLDDMIASSQVPKMLTGHQDALNPVTVTPRSLPAEATAVVLPAMGTARSLLAAVPQSPPENSPSTKSELEAKGTTNADASSVLGNRTVRLAAPLKTLPMHDGGMLHLPHSSTVGIVVNPVAVSVSAATVAPAAAIATAASSSGHLEIVTTIVTDASVKALQPFCDNPSMPVAPMPARTLVPIAGPRKASAPAATVPLDARKPVQPGETLAVSLQVAQVGTYLHVPDWSGLALDNPVSQPLVPIPQVPVDGAILAGEDSAVATVASSSNPLVSQLSSSIKPLSPPAGAALIPNSNAMLVSPLAPSPLPEATSGPVEAQKMPSELTHTAEQLMQRVAESEPLKTNESAAPLLLIALAQGSDQSASLTDPPADMDASGNAAVDPVASQVVQVSQSAVFTTQPEPSPALTAFSATARDTRDASHSAEADALPPLPLVATAVAAIRATTAPIKSAHVGSANPATPLATTAVVGDATTSIAPAAAPQSEQPRSIASVDLTSGDAFAGDAVIDTQPHVTTIALNRGSKIDPQLPMAAALPTIVADLNGPTSNVVTRDRTGAATDLQPVGTPLRNGRSMDSPEPLLPSAAAQVASDGTHLQTVRTLNESVPSGEVVTPFPGAPLASHASSTTSALAEPSSVPHAIPQSLEIGVAGGTHGWLKVRAELGSDGQVSASVITRSESSGESLRAQLPELREFMGGEKISVGSLAVHVVDSNAHAITLAKAETTDLLQLSSTVAAVIPAAAGLASSQPAFDGQRASDAPGGSGFPGNERAPAESDGSRREGSAPQRGIAALPGAIGFDAMASDPQTSLLASMLVEHSGSRLSVRV